MITLIKVKNATSQGDDYTAGCLGVYLYFKEYYNLIVINLSKQKALDPDPKAIEQINFNGNLEREAKKTVLDFPEETMKVL